MLASQNTISGLPAFPVWPGASAVGMPVQKRGQGHWMERERKVLRLRPYKAQRVRLIQGLVSRSLTGRQELGPLGLRCCVYMALSSIPNFRLEVVTQSYENLIGYQNKINFLNQSEFISPSDEGIRVGHMNRMETWGPSSLYLCIPENSKKDRKQ